MSKTSVIGKIVIEGKLILESPLLIGDGMGESPDNRRDIHVLKDRSGKPFIPGTSMCGVMRSYLRNANPDMIKQFFGGDDMQSSVQIDDIALEGGKVVFRDGVRIDYYTGRGIETGKYDYEAVERGAHGTLKMILTLRAYHDLDEIKDIIARLLKKLTDGIRVGALTAKGFGRVRVKEIAAGFYDFRNKNDIGNWLRQRDPSPARASASIEPTVDKHVESPKDMIVDADFAFNSSFIVRNYDTHETVGENKNPINAVSLKSLDEFVIPGTSLKGVLRHRAQYILDRLGCPIDVLDDLMGTSNKAFKLKSRFIVAESYISENKMSEVAQTRTRIDRFTGGVMKGSLFTTKPVWQSGDEPTLHIHFEIYNVKREAEVGLAIALLRDLWLGRIAIGGEKAVGRGTLSGRSARIKFKGKTYELDRGGKIKGDVDEFVRLSKALKNFSEEAN